MVLVYVSLAVVACSAMALAGYARRRPFPAPVPAPVAPIAGLDLVMLSLEDPSGEVWPPDEAAELIAAWRDQAAL